MEFEWDEAKAARNLARHGVDFLDAIEVFRDPFRLELEDDRADFGEFRLKTVGMVGGTVTVVIFTPRDKTTRIISARKAEPYERRAYHEGQAGPF